MRDEYQKSCVFRKTRLTILKYRTVFVRRKSSFHQQKLIATRVRHVDIAIPVEPRMEQPSKLSYLTDLRAETAPNITSLRILIVAVCAHVRAKDMCQEPDHLVQPHLANPIFAPATLCSLALWSRGQGIQFRTFLGSRSPLPIRRISVLEYILDKGARVPQEPVGLKLLAQFVVPGGSMDGFPGENVALDPSDEVWQWQYLPCGE